MLLLPVSAGGALLSLCTPVPFSCPISAPTLDLRTRAPCPALPL